MPHERISMTVSVGSYNDGQLHAVSVKRVHGHTLGRRILLLDEPEFGLEVSSGGFSSSAITQVSVSGPPVPGVEDKPSACIL